MERISPCTSAARLLLVALLAALSYELTTVSSARAATPCWQTLVTDWSDGRIDRTYPVACYRRALKALPEDIRLYSSATGDITQALAHRVRTTSRRIAGAPAKVQAAASSSAPVGDSGSDVLGLPLRLGGSLAILVGVLVGGASIARRKFPSDRAR